MDDRPKPLSKYDVAKNLAAATGATAFTYSVFDETHIALRYDSGGIGEAVEILRSFGWRCTILNGTILVR